MHTAKRDAQILSNVKNGRSNVQGAKRCNMDIEAYRERKLFLKNNTQTINYTFTEGTPIVETTFTTSTTTTADQIIEQKYDLDAGTALLKGVFHYEPQSAAEIEVSFKIDLKNWRLSTYWNKAQSNGTFLVSANITRKKVSDQDVIGADLLEAVKAVFTSGSITLYKWAQTDSNSKTLMVYMSDKHIGAVVPENGLYINTYDERTFAERMQLLLNEIMYLKNLYRKFSNIYILDLGDALDGWNGQTTRTGHVLPQNMNNRQAFETYLKTHKDFFDQLITSESANNFFFKAVTNDNHASDFGYITNRALEEYLNVKYPQVDTQIMSKFMEHFEVYDHTFILAHGKDDCDMKHGLPLHLNDKTVNFIDNYIYQNNIDSKTSRVHLIKGDLHQDTTQSSAKFRYRNTCSMFGSSKWAMHNFIPQAPGVSFDVIEQDTKRIFPYTLQFNASHS